MLVHQLYIEGKLIGSYNASKIAKSIEDNVVMHEKVNINIDYTVRHDHDFYHGVDLFYTNRAVEIIDGRTNSTTVVRIHLHTHPFPYI